MDNPLTWALLGIAAALLLWGAIAPRSQWSALTAWRRDRSGPPTAAIALIVRVVNIVAIVLLAGAVIVLVAIGR